MAKGTDVIESLFDSAYALREEKKELHDRIDANRKALRTMRDADTLTDEQIAEVDELYPPRKKSEDTETVTA